MNYKLTVIVPVIILILSLSFLFGKIETTGLDLDIDLKGGNQIIAESKVSVDERDLENILSEYDTNVRTSEGINKHTIFIEFDASIEPSEVLEVLEDSGYEFEAFSIQTVGPALGAAFFQQAITVLIMAFVFMAITIFIIFKTPLISFYISLCPFFDIIETLAITQLLGIKLSLASFASLLMIIGYSVDDDVMITTRVVKGSGETKELLKNSLKTSLTTTLATIVALAALYLLSISPIITQIASVLLIGLILDFQNTWLFNVPILRWYKERKKR